MIFTVGEINIMATDLQRSLDFYSIVLGFTIKERGDGYVHLDCNGQPFTLFEFAKEGFKNYTYGDLPAISLDLTVDDLEEIVKHFIKFNVAFVQDWKPGDTHTYIYDPDRLVFEIIQKEH